MKHRVYFLLALLMFVGAARPAASGAVTITFTNPTPILIPGSGTNGPASPYPSAVVVGPLPSPITDVNVTLNSLSHTFPGHIDILLVGPTGANVVLMSDAGGMADAVGVVLVLDDQAASSLPDGPTLTSGTFRPSNYPPNETFPPPAPGGPFGTALSVFNGTSPEGTWNLFVSDDSAGDTGQITLGWSLTISNDAQTLPEPTTLLLLGAALIGLASTRFRRRD